MESKQYADDGKRVDIYDQEHNREERPTRKLHNFNLPGFNWANQRLLKCVKMEDIEKFERMNNISIPRSSIMSSIEATKPNQTPQRIKFENNSIDVKCKSKKSQPIIISDDGDEYINDIGIEAEKEDDGNKPQDDDNESLPLKLRTRRAMAARGLRIEEPWKNEASDSRPRRTTSRMSFEEVHGRPKFSLTLSKKEIEDDFIQMTGCKPPKKPKRRPRAVQNYLDSIFPGLSLSEVTPATYKVRDRKK